MGYPISDEQTSADGVGHFANFEDQSAIYSLPSLGAWRIPKIMLKIWGGEGYEGGPLGYPIAGVADPTQLSPGVSISQRFQKGSIAFTNDLQALIAVYHP
ncbi:hypothetical protein CVH10_18980 [Halomonas sp. ND22Bw]|jgi:uncharacterized protein with LGFP repeats|nr:hypothetical protein CVH10_18980 [Halomonas sp. ND22Bw]